MLLLRTRDTHTEPPSASTHTTNGRDDSMDKTYICIYIYKYYVYIVYTLRFMFVFFFGFGIFSFVFFCCVF